MGTHPIFESDFDCLTDFKNLNPKCQDQHQPLMSEKVQKVDERPERVDQLYESEILANQVVEKQRQPRTHLEIKWDLEICGNFTLKTAPASRSVQFQCW